MDKPDAEKWVGSANVVLVFRDNNGNRIWRQGRFQQGRGVGATTRYAYCSVIDNGIPQWVGIPDDWEILAILPHPLASYNVEIGSGEHAGQKS